MDNFIANSNSFFNIASLILADLFILTLSVMLIVGVVYYVTDVFQTTHAIRRNYPLLGRFRYLFEHLGEFFRQYFFSMDREEMPFNRAQRSWVYRACKNLDNTQAFGSTRDTGKTGHIIFINSSYPVLDEDNTEIEPIVYGPFCKQPFSTSSLFNISGMSYGAISKPAIRALSQGAGKAGCWLNTGEGGLTQWHLEGNCDLVFQIGTAKYGVRDSDGNLCHQKLKEIAAHEKVRMFEIKLSQGAKPGKGGIVPAAKISQEIADIRGIPVNQASISPNRHKDIGNDEQLLDKIVEIREVSGKPVGIKVVLGDSSWLDELFSLIKNRGVESAPDFITLDSSDGGTGAAPMTLIDDMGLDIQETLPILVKKLNEYGLRERIKVIASGKLINPADVAWALCVGANAVVNARGFMFSLGCIQALQCNKNTCPTGIATHNPKLQRGLVTETKSARVAHYQQNMIKELTVMAHSCGVKNPGLFRCKHARRIIGANVSKALV